MTESEKWNQKKLSNPSLKVEFIPVVNALIKRNSNGNNTTHKDWFDAKCEQLGIDSESAAKNLKQCGIISKISRKQKWPVVIHMARV